MRDDYDTQDIYWKARTDLVYIYICCSIYVDKI
jgi:hypothetical protein